MNGAHWAATDIRSDNVRYLRPVTQRVIKPLQGAALDEYTRLIMRFEDMAHAEEKLQKQLRLIQLNKETTWLQIQAIQEARAK